MRGRWELSAAQWQVIEPILRPKRRSDGRGRPWRDPRGVLNGILWVLGTGAQWGELPKKYPPYQTCHRRFQQWVREGELEDILRVLAEELRWLPSLCFSKSGAYGTGSWTDTSPRGSAVHALHFATFNPTVASQRLLKPSPGRQGKRMRDTTGHPARAPGSSESRA